MDARFSKLFLSVLLIAVLALPALAISVPAGAQEGPKPEAVGLRPDAPPYALHGPYAVGVMEFDAETPSHPTEVLVWYPALNPESAEEIATYDFDYVPDWGTMPVTAHALKDAAPDASNGPYPLVVFAHGWVAARSASTFLCEHLASYGFVVISIDYKDTYNMTLGGGPIVPFYATLYDRPKDVSWEIDYAGTLTAAGGALGAMIDLEHVGVTGHSLGGYTTLAAAGAQLNTDWDNGEWLNGYPEIDALELRSMLVGHDQDLADQAGLDTVPDDVWPSWEDSRVDAIAPLAPAALVLDTPTLSKLTIPMMVLGGTADWLTPVPYSVNGVYDNWGGTPKAEVVFEGAGHMIFYLSCDLAPWMVDMGMFWFCSDGVWDMLRAHDLTDHFVTAFFLATLYDDADAAAALAPDAVAFPGITYEAEGF